MSDAALRYVEPPAFEPPSDDTGLGGRMPTLRRPSQEVLQQVAPAYKLSDYSPQQLAAARRRGALRSDGLPIWPPDTGINSRGEPYSLELTKMPAKEREAAKASDAFIQQHGWQFDTTATPNYTGRRSDEPDFEQLVISKESGGRPYVGWQNTDLTPWLRAGKVTEHGFPDWPGLPGPQGVSTAGGLYGITKTNWEKYAPLVGVSDFSPASQRKVYQAVLADQGENAWRPYWNDGKLRPQESTQATSLESTLKGISGDAHRLMEEAMKASPGSVERQELLRRAMKRSEELADEFREHAKHPPRAESDFDHMSSWAPLMIGLFTLAGAFTKRPAIGALNAAASALKGLHEGNMEQYKLAYGQWQDQNKLALDSFKLEDDEIQHIIKLEEIDERERLDRLRVALQVLGIDKDTAIGVSENSLRAKEYADRHAEMLDRLETNQKTREYDQARIEALRSGGGRGGKNIAVLDKDGKQVWSGAAKETPNGFVNEATGDPIEVPKDGSVKILGTSAGRQAQTMIMRITAAGNELAAAARNLVDLPIRATAGIFSGLQGLPPDQMKAAIGRSLANKLTPEDAQSVLVTFQGVARAIAQLEAAGAAQGLVGLTKTAQVLMPLAGDSARTILRKYAELRQIAERALETVSASPDISNEQKRLLSKIVEETQKAVPWTVQDVNKLEHNPNEETVRDFAKRMGVGQPSIATTPIPEEAIKELKSNPSEERRRQFDEIFGKGAAAKALGG